MIIDAVFNEVDEQINGDFGVLSRGEKGEKGDRGDQPDIDTELSTTSENPVQNKVITLAINEIKDALGDVGSAIDNILGVQDELIGYVKFTINKGELFASPRMTWQDWVESEYNTDGYTINEEGRVYWWLTGDMKLCDKSGQIQYATDKIINGADYEWKQ